MDMQKILNDIVQSAICMKAHWDTWWAFVHDGRLGNDYKNAIRNHSDFIRVTEHAHYTSTFIYFSHLFDNRHDVSSIPRYLSLIKAEIESDKYIQFESQYSELRKRAHSILKIRHKLVAHIDNQLSEADVFKEVGLTPDEIRDVLYDTAAFVAALGGVSVTPRDGRLCEAVNRVLSKLAH